MFIECCRVVKSAFFLLENFNQVSYWHTHCEKSEVFLFLILYQTSTTTGGLHTRGCALSSWASFSLEAVEKQNLLLPHISRDWLPFPLHFSKRRQQSGKDQRNLLQHQPMFASSFSVSRPFPLNLAAGNICSKFIVCFPRIRQEQSTSNGTRHDSL